MNKLAIIPIFFLTMCGTAPVTDPPAHACSLPLDGSPANCPDERDLILKPVELPKEQLKGEIDIYNPHHWQSIQMMFQRNMRKGQIERNAAVLQGRTTEASAPKITNAAVDCACGARAD